MVEIKVLQAPGFCLLFYSPSSHRLCQ